MDHPFGLRLIGGTILTYPTEERMEAAKARMAAYPTTRFTTRLYRHVGGWIEMAGNEIESNKGEKR